MTHETQTHAHPQHVAPARVLIGVFLSLLVLTVLTVAATHLDLGRYNILLALGIAVLKAGLVALYFMHLRWDSLFNGVIFIVAMLFVALFISLALVDSSHYYETINAYQQARPAGP